MALKVFNNKLRCRLPVYRRISFVAASSNVNPKTGSEVKVEREEKIKSRSVRSSRKLRLDEYLAMQYPEHQKKSLQAWIVRRKVKVDGIIVDKAGTPVARGQKVTLEINESKFVSRAGYKLEAAIDHFNIDVKDKICLDAGAGTGGFTDCLLQHGAKKVYAIDVGYGDVAYSIRMDSRVRLLERTNLKYLDPFSIEDAIDLATLDLSFISVLKVVPVILELSGPQNELIILIKPQFEAGKENVGKGGVVTDPEVHRRVIDKVVTGVESQGYSLAGVLESPIKGKDAHNVEFLSYFKAK